MTTPVEAPAGSLSLAALLGRVQLRYVAELEALLAAAGYPDLSLAHGANVLRHLTDGEPVRLGVLVSRSGLTKQSLSQQVAHLVSWGYVESRPDPDDGRARLLTPTARGLRSVETFRSTVDRLEADWRARHGHERIDQLRETLHQVLADDGAAGCRGPRAGGA